MMHLLSIVVLLLKITAVKSCRGAGGPRGAAGRRGAAAGRRRGGAARIDRARRAADAPPTACACGAPRTRTPLPPGTLPLRRHLPQDAGAVPDRVCDALPRPVHQLCVPVSGAGLWQRAPCTRCAAAALAARAFAGSGSGHPRPRGVAGLLPASALLPLCSAEGQGSAAARSAARPPRQPCQPPPTAPTHSPRYNTVMKLVFLGTSGTIVYLMRGHPSIRGTYDREQDTFRRGARARSRRRRAAATAAAAGGGRWLPRAHRAAATPPPVARAQVPVHRRAVRGARAGAHAQVHAARGARRRARGGGGGLRRSGGAAAARARRCPSATLRGLSLPPPTLPPQTLWTFSILLEAAAILPQLVLLQRTNNIDNLTGNYVALLGCARAGCAAFL